MIKVLHTADWQIGERFGRFDDEAALALTSARLDLVEKLGATATENGVDAVVVAGDVFDYQAIAEKTVRRLFAALSAYSGPWVFLPGNHDAALADSVWTRAKRLGCIPNNAHLCLTPEPLLLADGKLAILPAPLVQRHTTEDLTHWYGHAETPAGAVRLGLAHGRFGDVLPGDSDAKNVIGSDAVERGRLDYLALGDWHGTLQVAPRAWYSGTPETDRFVRNDSGNALIVELSPGGEPRVQRIRTGQYSWRSETVGIAVASDVNGLLSMLEEIDKRVVLKLEITGSVDLDALARIRDGLAKAEAKAHALLVDMAGLHIAPTDDDIANLKADGYVAGVVQELRDGQDSPVAEDAELNRHALEILAGMLMDAGQQEASR